MPKSVVILGATGSIGDSTFKVLEGLGERYRVIGISGGTRTEKLVQRAREWNPEWVCVADSRETNLVREALPGVSVCHGQAGLAQLATLEDADLIVNALVGGIGLQPTLEAVAAGKMIGMANKEPLVMAGGLILERSSRTGATILPLDSEPNAIWQCLKGEKSSEILRLILTASGGPFFGLTRNEMAGITPEQALAHPTWSMGPKITVDSATLMNKGFEVIEASWLFDVPVEQVEVLIHRESIVHSIVEFRDGAMLAHVGKTDMTLPIQYALTHPGRGESLLSSLDLAEVGKLSFSAPDRKTFGCLALCYHVGKRGGVLPAVLNAANEVAVEAFLVGEIGFLDIERINRSAVEACESGASESPGIVRGEELRIEAILAADEWSRQLARRLITEGPLADASFSYAEIPLEAASTADGE